VPGPALAAGEQGGKEGGPVARAARGHPLFSFPASTPEARWRCYGAPAAWLELGLTRQVGGRSQDMS